MHHEIIRDDELYETALAWSRIGRRLAKSAQYANAAQARYRAGQMLTEARRALQRLEEIAAPTAHEETDQQDFH